MHDSGKVYEYATRRTFERNGRGATYQAQHCSRHQPVTGEEVAKIMTDVPHQG